MLVCTMGHGGDYITVRDKEWNTGVPTEHLTLRFIKPVHAAYASMNLGWKKYMGICLLKINKCLIPLKYDLKRK